MRFMPLEGFFDTIGGLPLHPLVVHFAVVILPIAALAQIVLVFVPRLRRVWATPTLLALAGGTFFAFVAKETGEALAAHLGLPQSHALWGDILPPVAVALTLVTAVWWYLQRRGTATSVPQLVTQLLSAVLAVGVTVLTVLVGHTGAQAAWGGRIDTGGQTVATAPAATPSSAASSTTRPSTATSTKATPTPVTAAGFTMSKIAQHDTAASCWTAINGNVYDLTSWISAHPGGPGVIKSLCGTDGTQAFSAQHGRDQRVQSRLTTFKLGSLAG